MRNDDVRSILPELVFGADRIDRFNGLTCRSKRSDDLSFILPTFFLRSISHIFHPHLSRIHCIVKRIKAVQRDEDVLSIPTKTSLSILSNPGLKPSFDSGSYRPQSHDDDRIKNLLDVLYLHIGFARGSCRIAGFSTFKLLNHRRISDLSKLKFLNLGLISSPSEVILPIRGLLKQSGLLGSRSLDFEFDGGYGFGRVCVGFEVGGGVIAGRADSATSAIGGSREIQDRARLSE